MGYGRRPARLDIINDEIKDERRKSNGADVASASILLRYN